MWFNTLIYDFHQLQSAGPDEWTAENPIHPQRNRGNRILSAVHPQPDWHAGQGNSAESGGLEEGSQRQTFPGQKPEDQHRSRLGSPKEPNPWFDQPDKSEQQSHLGRVLNSQKRVRTILHLPRESLSQPGEGTLPGWGTGRVFLENGGDEPEAGLRMIELTSWKRPTIMRKRTRRWLQNLINTTRRCLTS